MSDDITPDEKSTPGDRPPSQTDRERARFRGQSDNARPNLSEYSSRGIHMQFRVPAEPDHDLIALLRRDSQNTRTERQSTTNDTESSSN